MKKVGIIFTTVIFLLMGCDETSKSVVSVNDEFKKDGYGSMVATIENAGDQLNLKGTLELTAGEFDIFLSNPSGDTIYSESFKEAGEYTVNEKFDRVIGDWVFSYKIIKVDDETPAGNFDFDFIYND
jgi:hypothetical protein